MRRRLDLRGAAAEPDMGQLLFYPTTAHHSTEMLIYRDIGVHWLIPFTIHHIVYTLPWFETLSFCSFNDCYILYKAYVDNFFQTLHQMLCSTDAWRDAKRLAAA